MKTGRTALVIVITLLQILLFTNIGFAQTKGEKDTFFFSGIVKNVFWGNQSIVVNDKKCFFTNDTRVVDQKGNRLDKNTIKENDEVAIDGIKQPNGSIIIKGIMVITNRGV